VIGIYLIAGFVVSLIQKEKDFVKCFENNTSSQFRNLAIENYQSPALAGEID
jgi:hypothetical protein